MERRSDNRYWISVRFLLLGGEGEGGGGVWTGLEKRLKKTTFPRIPKDPFLDQFPAWQC